MPYYKLRKIGGKYDWLLAEGPDNKVSYQDVQWASQNCDIVHMQSPAGQDAINLIDVYHKEGRGVMIDYDDYSFDLSPTNPRYAQLGCKECEVLDEKGEVKYRWRDGENGFDLAANNASFGTFVKCVRMADLVTVTTDYLADKFKSVGAKTAVLPNSIDLDRWKPLPRPAEFMDQIRIGWFGGDSHGTDLKMFKTLLPRICKLSPKVKIVMQAPIVPQWQDFFKDVPRDQLEWHGWTDLRYYPFFLGARHWDIGLAPLDNTTDGEFNKCKSSIKWMEFAAVGAACVAQNMLPYSASIEDGKTGMLADTEDEWVEKIDSLVRNPTLLCTMKDNAMAEVRKNHNLDINCKAWELAAGSVLEKYGKGG